MDETPPIPDDLPAAFALLIEECELLREPKDANGLVAVLAHRKVNRNGGFPAVQFTDMLRDVVNTGGPSYWWKAVVTADGLHEFWVAQDLQTHFDTPQGRVEVTPTVNRMAGAVWTGMHQRAGLEVPPLVFFGNVVVCRRGRNGVDLRDTLPRLAPWAQAIGIVLSIIGPGG